MNGSAAGNAVPSFGERLRAAVQAHGPLCVGIDPHRALVEQWGLPYDVQGLETFARSCVEAFGGQVALVKPQSAFFEVFGSAGVAVLERVLGDLRSAGTLTVLDVKRGDIGTTMEAYAQAYLAAGIPSAPDAVTVTPYLGYGALAPAVELAGRTGRGVFVLALTSNPEGPPVQHAVYEGRSVAGRVVDGVTADNADARAHGRLGSVGMVVGATVGRAVTDLGLDLAAANAPLLAPGLGAQGADESSLREVFGAALPNVVAASSRDVLAAGPSVQALRQRARRTAEVLADVLVADV